MYLGGKNIGFALTGSHCTYAEIWPEIRRLKESEANIFPIVSPAVATSVTRFGRGEEIVQHLEQMTGRRVIDSIVDAEPIGPKKLLDCLIIAPCTGNTLAKLANGITDTAVLMAAKAQLRNGRPVLVALATNDALSLNAGNLGRLLHTKNVFFVPFGQDNAQKKKTSMVADMQQIPIALEAALQGEQLQPICIERTTRTIQ